MPEIYRSRVSLSSPTYVVINDAGMYKAYDRDGSLIISNTNLKTVVDAIKGSDRWIHFAEGTFNFGSDEYFQLVDLSDIIISGSGIDATILQNTSELAQDTEVINGTRTTRLTLRDMTISAGGGARSTSDAIDLDGGNECLIERVKIIASRARGIVFDGKDTAQTADRNVIRDCIITGTQGASSAGAGIQILAGEHNLIEGCHIYSTTGPGINIAKASSGAAQPNKKATGNRLVGNHIIAAGREGILVTSSDDNVISGNVILNSSTSGSNTFDGVRFDVADAISCDDNVVSANRIGDTQGSPTQRYGVNVGDASCNRTIVAGNNLKGNVTGDTNDLGTGTVVTQLKSSHAVTFLVAANDANASVKAAADYLCDGTNDHSEIVAAITALPSGGGTIVLSEGTFNWGAPQTNVLRSNLRVIGAGRGATIVKLADNVNDRLMSNTEANVVSNVTFADLTFDGNKNNQTDGANRDARSLLHLARVSGLTLRNVEVKNGRSGAALRMYGCDGTSIIGCYFHDNGLATTLSGNTTLPTATITVGSTTGFASSGKIDVGGQVVTYTGKTTTTFTGCSGGSGTENAGTWVAPRTNDVNEFLLICDATFAGSQKHYRVEGNRFENNTDTGTAMDGVTYGAVVGNVYDTNALGVGVGWSNAEFGLAAASCFHITVADNVIKGANQATNESQGIKLGQFGNTGNGNNKHITITGNSILHCDRAIWIDQTDRSVIADNVLADAVGPNGQLLLIAPASTSVNGLKISDNLFYNTTNRGISFDAGTISNVDVHDNTFLTVTSPIDGTIPTDTRIRNNRGHLTDDGDAVGLSVVIDGGGSAITTGAKAEVRVPFPCTVTGWDVVADQSGSIVVDVLRATYANFPTFGTIAGSEKPTLSSAQKNQDTSLTTWTTSLAKGDFLRFNVDSASTVTRVTVALYLRRV